MLWERFQPTELLTERCKLTEALSQYVKHALGGEPGSPYRTQDTKIILIIIIAPYPLGYKKHLLKITDPLQILLVDLHYTRLATEMGVNSWTVLSANLGQNV